MEEEGPDLSPGPSGPSGPLHGDRRAFLGAAGGAALLCSLRGTTLGDATPADIESSDRAATALVADRRAGRRAAFQPVDRYTFETPEPQPGGSVREYWLQARQVTWNVAPTGQDEWMKHPVRGKRTFRALVYRPYSAGFASPLGPAQIPGPTLHAEVGDVIRVHFRNGARKFAQALTVHPHGVHYTPEYDGVYLGDFTRAGGFIAPGEEFTYTWEATPDAVGAWPYHDHGPNHTINIARGLFGAIVIRPKGAPVPDVEHVLFFHSIPGSITGTPSTLQCINGRVAAGNTPTLRAKVGQRVQWHVFGMDAMFHTFHVHGHRWKAADGTFQDCRTVGPNETLSFDWREDNPGRWLYHCHVSTHQDAGMAGWYLVER